MGTTRPALNHVSNRPSLAEVPDTINSSDPSRCENHAEKKRDQNSQYGSGRTATGHMNAVRPVLHDVHWAHTVITNEFSQWPSDISAQLYYGRSHAALQKVAEIMCYSEAAVLLMWSACFSGEPHGWDEGWPTAEWNTFPCRQGSWDQPAGRAAVALSTQGWPVCDCQTTQREWEIQSNWERMKEKDGGCICRFVFIKKDFSFIIWR